MFTCVRLCDGKLSVRYDGREFHILPNRLECSAYDLERAFNAASEFYDQHLEDAECDAVADVRRDLSRW